MFSLNRLTAVSYVSFMFTFLIISSVSSEHISFLEENFSVSGYSYYYDMVDVVYVNYSNSGSLPVYGEADMFANSSSDRFLINTYTFNNDLGHSHDCVYSGAHASAEWIFQPLLDGNFNLAINVFFEWKAWENFFTYVDNETGYQLVDLTNGQTMSENLYNAIDYVSQDVNTADFSEILNLDLLSTNQYSFRMYGNSGTNGSGMLLEQSNFLAVNLERVPEFNTIIFLLVSLLSLTLIRKRNGNYSL